MFFFHSSPNTKMFTVRERVLSFEVSEKIQAILLDRFAAQQPTSSFWLKKFGWFCVKVSAEFKKFSLSFQKQQKGFKKHLKLKYSRKTYICVFPRLTVKRQVEMQRLFCHILITLPLQKEKRNSTLSFINP